MATKGTGVNHKVWLNIAAPFCETSGSSINILKRQTRRWVGLGRASQVALTKA